MNNIFIIIIIHNKTDYISEKNFILKENDAMNWKQNPKAVYNITRVTLAYIHGLD